MLVQGYFYSGEKRILEVSYPSRLTVNTAFILDLWSGKPFVYTYSEVHTQKNPLYTVVMMMAMMMMMMMIKIDK